MLHCLTRFNILFHLHIFCYLTPNPFNPYLKYLDTKVIGIGNKFDFGTRAIMSVFLLPFPALTVHAHGSHSPCADTPLLLFLQFPAVNHPQTLERRYLGILNSVLLDLMKVGQVDIVCIKCLLVYEFFCVFM